MTIDIDQLTEAELVALNHRIVERVRFIRHMRTQMTMLQFRIGERVSFQPDDRERVFGVITRYNKKSVSVLDEDGGRWTVPPSILQSESPDAETVDAAEIIGMLLPPPGK